MDTSELLAIAEQDLQPTLTGQDRRQLDVLVDQLRVLRTDEHAGDGDVLELQERRSRLQTRLTALQAVTVAAREPAALETGGYRSGACLALRFVGWDHLPDPQDLEEAVRRTRESLDLAGPPLADAWTMGGGCDLWFFVSRPPGISEYALLSSVFLFGLALQARLAQENTQRPAILLDWDTDGAPVRCGGERTIVARSIRDAQHVVQGASSGHIIISPHVRQTLGLSSDGLDGPIARGVARVLGLRDRQFGCRVDDLQVPTPTKRVLPLHTVRLYHDGRMVAGARGAYLELTGIEHREPDADSAPGHVFVDRLASHDDCVIIGITHEHLAARYLKPALQRRLDSGRGFWKRLVVIFPTVEATSRVVEGRAPEERRHRRAEGLRSVHTFLISAGAAPGSWKLAEYQENLSFTGNWMRSGPRNSIRFSPLLPGSDVAKSFMVELQEGTVAFAEARRAFTAIEQKAVEIGEWNMFGLPDTSGALRWHGITDRSIAVSPRGQYEAVVLILIHGLTRRGRRVYLQLRENLNSSSALGLYSNISGRVTTDDAFEAKRIKPPLMTSPSDDTALMADLHERTAMRYGEAIPQDVWLQAAVREVEEELGLSVDAGRLVPHGTLPLDRGDSQSLFFTIYSLALRGTTAGQGSESEIQRIRTYRRESRMEREFGLREIAALVASGGANALLTTRIDRFLEIYRGLGIVEE